MTDGIIQKVFNKELHYYDNYESNNPDITIDQHLQVIEEMKQELIEEIKKRFPIDYDENYSMWHEAIQKILIGDNE